MLYLISGASRAGKTLLAQKLAKQEGLSYFSLDWLVMGFTNGMPEHGIHHLLFPDEIAIRTWPFLKAMFNSMIWGEEDYIIEGEAILPELIATLLKEHPGKVKVCFLGFADIDGKQKIQDIKTHRHKKDWLVEKSDAYILDHINNMVAHSALIEQSCRKHDLPYFDTAKDFTGTMEQALQYLTA
jgi:2-phosphoglycerate kinase